MEDPDGGEKVSVKSRPPHNDPISFHAPAGPNAELTIATL